MKTHLPHPPRGAEWLFIKLLPFDHQKASLGDIEEIYAAIAEDEGAGRANLWYVGQVLLALPHAASNFTNWGLYMIRHYAISAFRSFRRNLSTSLVNVIGLAVAVGAAIVMFLFINLQVNMDRFHEHLDRIYLVEYRVSDGSRETVWANSPVPLGPALASTSSQVEQVVRMATGPAVVRRGNRVFDEQIQYADPAFFDVFTFPLSMGDVGDFEDRDGAVLSPALAEKYFGSENPIGQHLELIRNNGTVETLTVRAVIEKAPQTASFAFDLLVPYERLRSVRADPDGWDAFTSATFVMLNAPVDKDVVEAQLQSFIPAAQAANIDRKITKFSLVPLRNVPTQGLGVQQNPIATVNPYLALTCSVIALMVLLVASFNYVTVAIASSFRRAKEIGVRKVMGSYRIQLVLQFLGENILISITALILGVLLADFALVPWINSLQDGGMFELDFGKNTLLWVFLLLILVVTGMSAGLYPAVFISRFSPGRVLRGPMGPKGKRYLTQGMLTLQLLFSFILLAFGFALYQNASYQRKIDWGYDPHQTIVIPFSAGETLRRYEDEISGDPDILMSAGTVDHVSRAGHTTALTYAGQSYESLAFDVGPEYLETMKIRLREGRFFNRDSESEARTSVIVNEKFLRHIGLEEGESGLGRTVRIGDENLEIIGVTENFYYQPFILGIGPLMFRLADQSRYRYLAVDYPTASGTRVADYLEATWKRVVPDAPYRGFHQDEVFNTYFVSMASGARIFGFISGAALVIAIVGLFGLVLISVTRRGREIGIRRMLGASVWGILGIMHREVAVIVAVVIAVAVPLSWFGITAMFHAMIPDAHGLTSWFVVLPTIIVVTFTSATSFAGVYRGANTNPVDVLRENAA